VECGEAHGEWGPRTCALHYYTEDCDSVFNKALAAGAKLILPMKDQFYGDRGGGLIDSWGNHWYIATRKEDLTLEEIRQRAAQAS
jgi:PhnB protein